MEDLFHLTMSPREINQISVLGLAHCGDAVFELLVRSFLCTAGKEAIGNLHRATVERVCAPAQARRATRSPKTPRASSMPRPRAWNACLGPCIWRAGWSG